MITGMLYQDTIQQKLNILKDYRQGAGMWDGAIQTFDRLENSIDTPKQEGGGFEIGLEAEAGAREKEEQEARERREEG